MTAIMPTPIPPRKPSTTSTSSRHRRSTVSLHSPPGLGLIRTISRDLVTGWHTPTALTKEDSHASTSSASSASYKPRYAARDALKCFGTSSVEGDRDTTTLQKADSRTSASSSASTSGAYRPKNAARDALKTFPPPAETTPTTTIIKNDPRTSFESEHTDSCHQSMRTRQDSVVPLSSDALKPIARVEDGLVPDHSFDTWSSIWESAYEKRVATLHSVSSTPPCTTAGTTTSAVSGGKQRKKRPPPLSGKLCASNTQIRDFIFEKSEVVEGGCVEEQRRASEVPSLVLSDGSSRSCGLEDLEEDDEEEADDDAETNVTRYEKVRDDYGTP